MSPCFFLNDTKAVNHDSFWHGGPDFAIEIVSPGDQTLDKLTFYAATQTRELLIIDRAPWQLELYRLKGSTMELATIATTSSNTGVLSESTSLQFRLLESDNRPRIQILHSRLGKSWTV